MQAPDDINSDNGNITAHMGTIHITRHEYRAAEYRLNG